MQGGSSTYSYNLLPSAHSSGSMISFIGEPTVQEEDDDENRQNGKLSAVFGVVVPVILSMFSVILFLRLGYVVGQAGLILGIALFVVAYLVVSITVLSISAIATNGVVKGGGAYYMISRTLGPEFGGSIGVIFFFANIFASALYILGFVEALIDDFGPTGVLIKISELKQDNYWYELLYGTGVLLLCLAICLVGAEMFAKTSFLIFLAVMTAVVTVIVSFLIQTEKKVGPASANPISTNYPNRTYRYTSWSIETANRNLWPHFSRDYTESKSKHKLDVLSVFGVLFNGVTGIMAGVNMSGDLKNPGRAIPFGTLWACLLTFVIYIILVIFTGFTCSRELLHENYNYLQPIDKVPVIIAIGVFAATLSAALSCLIGASRILHALAKDKLLGFLLQPFVKVSGRNHEPIRAVLLSWLFVQIVLFLGKVNKVAPLVSMFFLLSYGVTNFACFALKVASAPNFRPTFKYFSWQTALFGGLFCFIIMFLIDALYATISIAVMILLFVFISLRAPVTPWGDVSQALIYHQVRKYLLRLDIRKDHVKFWRPQILLLVSNPRSSYNLIDFVNDIKKSGMYILGHVQVDEFKPDSVEQHKKDLVSWLNFVDCAEIKSFVELSIAPNVRQGAQNLILTSGLGSMRANTVVLGFFDDNLPEDRLSRGVFRKTRFFGKRNKEELFQRVLVGVPRLRLTKGEQEMNLDNYVGIIKDAITMSKNVCIARNFELLDKNSIAKGGYIDVWPVNATLVREGFLGPYDFTFLLILQLSCVLHMVPFWESRTTLRVLTVVGENRAEEECSLIKLLKELRIPAEVRMIHALDEGSIRAKNADGYPPVSNWYRNFNHLMRTYSSEANVIFTGLPHPPVEENMTEKFIQELSILSENLPPIMMVYGRSPVVSTSL